MTTKPSNLLYTGIQLTLAIASIAWGIAYGYENYQGDRCNEAFAALAATNQTRLNNVQARIESSRTREIALQNRAGELAAKFSGPARDRK